MREPINPADIRVGDRVERVWKSGESESVHRLRVTKVDGQVVVGDTMFFYVDADSVEWFLLDRPDPLAEVVEVIAVALDAADDNTRAEVASVAYRRLARAALAAITERWELVERGKP